MVNLPEELERLAELLEAEPAETRAARRKKRLERTLEVAAFGLIWATGWLGKPVAIEVGDDLFIAGEESPRAGTIYKPLDADGNPVNATGARSLAGRIYATALESFAAGKIGEMRTALFEKRWDLGGGGKAGNCDECIQNADAGWIPADEPFPSGHDEPELHPNCTCDLSTRRAEAEE